MTARSKPEVSVIDTGIANAASVSAAFARCGADVRLITDRKSVEHAGLLVLPGVGSFGAGMERLCAEGLDRVLLQRVRDDRPTLAICLGMQLLCVSSQETPGVSGLGILDGRITPFTPSVRCPQFGWNLVEADHGCRVLRTGYAYFANSFKLEQAPAEWQTGVTIHGSPFVSAVERGNILACQFHPELSGSWGKELLCRWMAMSREETRC